MRVGIYGGSFDPPHAGHLMLAADAVERLGLDLLLFVPAATQPFKTDTAGRASAAMRLEMLRAAVGSDPGYRVEALEVDRGGLSYTVDTLEELASKFPGAELFLVVGEDALAGLGGWRRPDRIRELATLAILRRHERPESAGALPEGVVEASSRLVNVSSSEIRGRVKAGKSIRGFVSEAVENYISAHALYR